MLGSRWYWGYSKCYFYSYRIETDLQAWIRCVLHQPPVTFGAVSRVLNTAAEPSLVVLSPPSLSSRWPDALLRLPCHFCLCFEVPPPAVLTPHTCTWLASPFSSSMLSVSSQWGPPWPPFRLRPVTFCVLQLKFPLHKIRKKWLLPNIRFTPPPPPRARFHNTWKPETLFPLFIVLAPGPFTCIAGAQEVLLKWREGVGWGGIDEQRKIFPWKCWACQIFGGRPEWVFQDENYLGTNSGWFFFFF